MGEGSVAAFSNYSSTIAGPIGGFVSKNIITDIGVRPCISLASGFSLSSSSGDGTANSPYVVE